MYRLQGELYLQTDAPSEAEQSFQTAITVARQQQARLWGFRATVSLARLWQQQNKNIEAQTQLAAIVDSFREGAELPVWSQHERCWNRWEQQRMRKTANELSLSSTLGVI